MQLANIISIITNKSEPQQKQRLGTVKPASEFDVLFALFIYQSFDSGEILDAITYAFRFKLINFQHK